MEFTEKQKKLIMMLKNDEFKRLNIFYGSVRSGKTFISLIIFALWVAQSSVKSSYLMCAKTLKSLERNCLEPLIDLVGEENFKYSLNQKNGKLFGRKLILEGANDALSEGKIRGTTLRGAYADELTLINKDFFMMLLSRLSENKSKFFGTTNPDSPAHWLKTDFLDKQDKLDLFVDKFLLEDNTTLDPEYVKQLKNEYSGIYYDRFILGNFVRAEGLVFPRFANNTDEFLIPEHIANIEISNNPDYRIIIGVDFGGNKSKTCFISTAISYDYRKLYVLDEYEVDNTGGVNYELIKNDIDENKISFEIDTNKICSDLFDFHKKIESVYGKVDYVFCDSASPTMINSIRSFFKLHNTKFNHIHGITKNPVSERPKTIDNLFNTDRLKICSKCSKLIFALQNLVWDDKKENIPLDLNENNINDIYDAFCYSWLEFVKRIDFNI